MAVIDVEYQKLKKTEKTSVEVSSIWNQFKSPIIIKEFASVSDTVFHTLPSGSPSHFLSKGSQVVSIATSTRIQIFNPANGQIVKSISRFADTVLSCQSNEKLLVAGDQGGKIQIFDLTSRAVLRTLQGHQGPVRSVSFITDKQILSASDDKTIKIWDLISQQVICQFDGHEDYVRCAIQSPSNPALILSASYDHTVKLWDSNSKECILTLDHGAPVEKCLFLPGGALVASCGSNTIKLWDITLTGAGKLVQIISPHQKTITCMTIVKDAENSWLVSGSLDQQVKVIDLTTHKVVGGFKYPSPILSLAVSNQNTCLAVGMASGLFSLRKRIVKSNTLPKSVTETKKARGGTSAHFNRHVSIAPKDATLVQVTTRKQKKLGAVDKFLRSFRYSKALDHVLGNPSNLDPEMVVSLLRELVYRDAINAALSGRDETTLEPVLEFTAKFISNPSYQPVLITVMEILLDLYGHVLSRSGLVEGVLKRLKRRVEEEIKTEYKVCECFGIVSTLCIS